MPSAHEAIRAARDYFAEELTKASSQQILVQAIGGLVQDEYAILTEVAAGKRLRANHIRVGKLFTAKEPFVRAVFSPLFEHDADSLSYRRWCDLIPLEYRRGGFLRTKAIREALEESVGRAVMDLELLNQNAVKSIMES